MDVEKLADRILSSRKYRNVCRGTIIRLIQSEQDKYKGQKAVIKAARDKLHQVYGAFLICNDYNGVHSLIRQIDRQGNVKDICRRILMLHRSTLERMDIYDRVYKEIFQVTGIPNSIMDIACGFNPFSIPWMELPQPIPYHVYDIDSAMVKAINEFLITIGYPPLARLQDVVHDIPQEQADLAFLFKFLPTVEQLKRGFTEELLSSLRARFIVVSFPLTSVTGKAKEMLRHYTEVFGGPLSRRFGILSELLFDNELFLILHQASESEAT